MYILFQFICYFPVRIKLSLRYNMALPLKLEKGDLTVVKKGQAYSVSSRDYSVVYSNGQAGPTPIT